MKKNFTFVFITAVILMLSTISPTANAQTASTGIVLGSVTDPGGSVVPDAKVQLTNTATNEMREAVANSAGQYIFPYVAPGEYTLKVNKQGFRTTSSAALRVDVAKSYTMDFKLELGTIGQTVQVEATAQVELQTTDAQVGSEVSSEVMTELPTLRRNAAALLTLQPGVTPGTGTFPRVGMRVAGAIDDQNTFTLDGIDVTDNIVGGLGADISVIPLGVAAVEEFRVGVNNPNASFGRASGGQIAVVGKSGTNNLHGQAYWVHENTDFNANEWELNRIKLPRPVIHDNRFGTAVGAPIRKDKTFFFFNYEGRRFPQQSSFTRLMPSSLLKQGTLQFTDCSSGKFDSKGNCIGGGTLRSYNLASSTFCGSGATPCDPRGLGISPSVAALWALDPAGTDPSVAGADGQNTVGFHGTASAPLSTNFYTSRFDHQINSKWRFNGSYTYFQTKQVSGGQGAQYDIRGGAAKATSTAPTDRDAIIAGLTGQVTPHLFNSFHFGWVRARQSFNRLAPSAAAALENIVGTSSSAGPIALAPGQAATNLVDAPIEVDTQRARFQNSTGRNIQYVDDVSWIKAKHTLQFGANFRHIPTIHTRNDKVVGSLASLEALADADISTFLSSIPSSERPPTCSAAITTNCLQKGDEQRWDRFYASTLGLVDNVGILTTRDGNLKPLPFGTPLVNNTTLNAVEFYGQDVWRITPNLTFTYGLSYGWQTAPKEKLNRQTLVVDTTNNNQSLTGPGYIAAKQAAALQGQTYNPTLGFDPVKSAGRNVFNIDWGDVAPRVSAAWTPSFDSGFMHRLTGNRKTVIRGGFGIVYDRINTVQSVIIPMLGVGFAQTISVGAPLCDASATPGAGCNTAAGTGNPGAASFRVGVDGNLPVPAVPAVSIPVVPSTPFGELFSFQDDPNTKVGRSRAGDLTIQREIPGNMIVEIGWTGRWSDRLPQGVNFNSAPYFFVDPASKQSFAQAYDVVAAALAAGQTPAAQPFFENQLAGLIGSACKGSSTATTATQFLTNAAGSTFTGGLVSSLFSVMDGRRTCLGLPTFQNRQLFDLHMRTYIGKSNYNGLIATLRKRTSHGLIFDASYTFSKTLDQNISNQNQAGVYSNSYFPNVDYGASLFDRKHIFNFTYVYDLPVGKGHRFGGGSLGNRLLGGWYTTGIFSAFSGLPLFVTESSQVWGGGSIFGSGVGMIPTVDPSTFGNSQHGGVCAGPGNPGSSGDGPGCASLYKPGTVLSGSSDNLFGNPAAVFADFRNVQISKDGRTGRSNPLHGLPFWNLDSSLGKKTALTERVSFSIQADFFNIFNHVNFVDPSLNLTQRASFGVISQQLVPTSRDNILADGSRWIQLGLRVSF